MTDRELDALVAERVMGWTPLPGECSCHGKPIPNGCWRLPDGSALLGALHDHGGPAYSTSGDGLLAVVEEMRRRGFYFDLASSGPHAGPFTASFLTPAISESLTDMELYERLEEVSSPTAPRAVSLAALKALGVEVEA